MYNVLMYDDKKGNFCSEFDISSKETVLNDYIIPYLSNQPFFIDGVELTKSKISKVIVSKTENGIDSAVQSFRAKHKGSGIVVMATRENIAQDDALVKIETNEFLKEAYSMIQTTQNVTSKNTPAINNNKVFIVYGHEEALQLQVKEFVQKLGLEPVILSDEPNQGKTIIEKLSTNSDVGFAVVLYTPDDTVQNGGKTYHQPRPNVMFEYGYFMGKLGRNKIALIVNEEIKSHSDIVGVGYINVNDWRLPLAQELKAAGYAVDLNKLVNG